MKGSRLCSVFWSASITTYLALLLPDKIDFQFVFHSLNLVVNALPTV